VCACGGNSLFLSCFLSLGRQYYESFSEGHYLYISMELVEGVSLMDHLNSLSGKNRRMPESDIWQARSTTHRV
jgi:hypothetical protein